jgi:hypothetical protein
MSFKKFGATSIVSVLSFASLLGLSFPSIAHANPSVCAWIGPNNGNFSTAANWSGCNSGAPTSADSLVFTNTGNTSVQTVNDDIIGLSIASFVFNGINSSNGFRITGDPFQSTGGIYDYTDTSTGNVITNPVSAYGAVTIYADNIAGLTIGALGGAGNVIVDGGQSVILQDLSGFTGTLDTGDSTIDLAPPNTNTMTSSGSIEIYGEGLLKLQNSTDSRNSFAPENFDIPISLGSTNSNDVALDLSNATGGEEDDLTGPVTLTSNVTISSDADYSMNITGPIYFGGYSLASENPGVVSVSVSADTTNVSIHPVIGKNVVFVNDGYIGTTTVDNGGLLKGNGDDLNTTINAGGEVAPGHSPGCLYINGDFTSAGTDTVDIQSPGMTACTDYDQIVVYGAVNLTGSTLNTVFLNGFTPSAGQSFEIINNQGTGPITGIFNGLPEGSVFSVGSSKLMITYTGGTGNDVVLKVVSPATTVTAAASASTPSTPNTGFTVQHKNPVLTVLGYSFAAAAVLLLARRLNKAAAKK